MTTKDRLLESALAVFAERGTDGGSMREIAKRAGVNVATAYHHFGSKRDLLLAIFRDLGFVDAPQLDEWPPPGTPPEQLETTLFWSWVWMRGGSNVIRLAVGEALKGDTEVQSVFEEWQIQGDAALQRMLLQAGLATQENVETRAWIVRQVVWATFVQELMYRTWSDDELVAFAQKTAAQLLSSWQPA